MVTDVKRVYMTQPGHPRTCNVCAFYKFFFDDWQDYWDLCRKAKIGCGKKKELLAERIIERFAPFREVRAELTPDAVARVLDEGSKRPARSRAPPWSRSARRSACPLSLGHSGPVEFGPDGRVDCAGAVHPPNVSRLVDGRLVDRHGRHRPGPDPRLPVAGAPQGAEEDPDHGRARQAARPDRRRRRRQVRAPTSPNTAFIMADGGGDNAAGDARVRRLRGQGHRGQAARLAINCSHLGCPVALNSDAKRSTARATARGSTSTGPCCTARRPHPVGPRLEAGQRPQHRSVVDGIELGF